MNNPRAFPSSSDRYVHHGMTLLDYFAGQALVGLLSDEREDARAPRSDVGAARASYDIAEAMLAERERRQK